MPRLIPAAFAPGNVNICLLISLFRLLGLPQLIGLGLPALGIVIALAAQVLG